MWAGPNNVDILSKGVHEIGQQATRGLEMILSPVGDTRTHQVIRALDEAAERIVSFAAGVAFAALAILPAMARAQTIDVAIALAADVSRSIDDEEFQLQRRGYAAAVTSPSSCKPFSRARVAPSRCASSNGQGPISRPWL